MASLLTEVGRYLLMLRSVFKKPENFKMYWNEFMHQCAEIGLGSLPIVFIISLFLGAVTTVQTAYQLVSPLVPNTTIGQVTRDTIILELSPTVVCIVLAGVVGSKIASELGNMRVTEQIDAIEIMGISPSAYLILPKILAALLVVPMLIIISIVLAIWGGRIAASLSGIIPTLIFDRGVRNKFNNQNFIVALTKSYTFAFIVSSVPAYYGFNVRGGALEIGRAGTKAVIVSCIMILIADYFIAAILL